MTERILCLDSDTYTQEVVRDFLRGESYECDVASTSAEAFLLLRHGRYALFMTELDLPDDSGIEVMKQARGIDGELACILITAMMDVNDAVEAMRAGASDFLVKPFHLGNLVFTVGKTLERRRLLLENRQYQHGLESSVHAATAELEKANQELRRTRDYLENLLNSSVDTIVAVDASGVIAFVNQGASDMLGYAPDALLGQPLARLLRGGEIEVKRLLDAVAGGPLKGYETEMVHQNQTLTPVMMSISLMASSAGEEASVLAICKDITQQKALENELKELSTRDALTGLYNQRFFYERLEIEIERARRQNHPLSLLLFDVDHFKEYNDTHGHLEGDHVLRVIGEVVRECTRDYVDIGCRYGGDEFTVILPETGESHAASIAERIRASFEARRFGGCTLSVGLMTYRRDSTPQSFIRFADEMMYDAKRSGGNRVYVYNPESEIPILQKPQERSDVSVSKEPTHSE